MKNGFFLIRFIKKVFYTGLIHILPTVLVISILVIGYNFLEKNLGSPINTLIKKQLAGKWKFISLNYLKINPDLFSPVRFETYEELVKRIQNTSITWHEAKKKRDEALRVFNDNATPLLQKKESSSDTEYIRFLEQKIDEIRQSSGLKRAEFELEREEINLRKEIERENEFRLTKQKWGNDQPQKLKAEINKKYPHVIGIIIALFIIFFVGVIIHSVAGRSLKRYWEKTISALPFVRKLYPYTKQLTEFLLENKKTQEFKSVVLIEYPRKGVYALGFPTGEINMQTADKKKKISVFIPSSPTPFTGYTVIIDEMDVTPLNISVEEAIRFSITGGVIKPKLLESIIKKTKKPEIH